MGCGQRSQYWNTRNEDWVALWRAHRPHLVHSLSDEGIVSECFKEGERLVDGIGDVQLRVYEMLKKSLFQGLGQGEHPIKRGRLRKQRQKVSGAWGVALCIKRVLKGRHSSLQASLSSLQNKWVLLKDPLVEEIKVVPSNQRLRGTDNSTPPS